MLMLCIKGTVRTNTETGRVYTCVGRFICPHCESVADILEFDAPVAKWFETTCLFCGEIVSREARYAHQSRFVPLTGSLPNTIAKANTELEVV